ncbi:MAG: RtcB family protein [Candidatus Marinimicrobia bacterium]|nr:RtcB family protein [Candidatus Neomarinimicrobiota bacterium]
MPIKQTITIGKVPVYIYSDKVEAKAKQQLENVSKLPIIHHHVAAMPDVHWGMGATIGSVIPTIKAIIPAAVGVDIGCGMMACKLNLNANDLPDNLSSVRVEIEQAVPHGRTNNGGRNDKGAWRNPSDDILAFWSENDIKKKIPSVLNHHPKLIGRRTNSYNHLGTLGTGNHFIEVCLDEKNDVWIMLHSGSRGIGNRIGMYFIRLARKEAERQQIHLPDRDLAYLPEGSTIFNDYIKAVKWAQDFALVNRQFMMQAILLAVSKALKKPIVVIEKAINCHHNYVEIEIHYNKKVWLTRKGAIRARKGDLGIIPGSMGTKSYIVRGKGNPESFHSCAHGAGRTMSRNEAKRRFTVTDLAEQTSGVECRKDKQVIDEIPGAYKDIDLVMENQNDLVEIVHTLKQVVCVKG